MTEHQPGTREWAEAEARKGAEVRHEDWSLGEWATFRDGLFMDESGTTWAAWIFISRAAGWSLYEPAPAQAPDLAARVAELERRFEAHDHCAVCGKVVDTREVSEGGDPNGCQLGRDWVCSPDCEDRLIPEPTFTTSRKPDPEPGVMTNAQIIDAAIKLSVDGVPEAATVIRLTRASIRAQLAANEQAGRDAAYTIWNAENSEHDSVKFAKAIRAVFEAHKEGV